MSEKLFRVTAKEVISAIEKLGFKLSRQSGSHKIYKNSKGQRVTIPFHGNKTLHPKIIKSIMKDAGITLNELKNLF